MAYVGAAPANRVLSSADIAQGSVTLDDINFTDQPANMDISGTINKHTMRLADGVTVTGDVTISDDLVLSKLSDDGNAITLTNDSSTRTITGSGSIEASTLAQTPNASLTGMTGTIGSEVVLPAETVVWVKFVSQAGVDTRSTATAYTSVGLTLTILAADVAKVSKIIIQSDNAAVMYSGATHTFSEWRIQRTGPATVETARVTLGHTGTSPTQHFGHVTLSLIDTPGVGNHTYVTQFRKGHGNADFSGDIAYKEGGNSIIAYGIK